MAGILSTGCEVHPGIQVTAVCITCDAILVCVECITDKRHQGHVFGKSSKIADDIKTKLKQKEAEDSKLITNLESDLNEVKSIKTQQDNDQEERVKAIKKQKETLMHSVNEMADDFISQYESKTQGNCAQLQDAIADISLKLENVKRHRTDLRRIMAEKEDIVVVCESRKLKDHDANKKSYPELANIKLTLGKMDKNQLKLMLVRKDSEMEERGSLQGAQTPATLALPIKNRDPIPSDHTIQHGISLVLQSSFKHNATNYVTRLCGDCTGNAWLTCQNGMEVTLADKTGQVLNTVTFDTVVISMATVGENTLFVCGFDDKYIRQVSLPSTKVTSAFSTGKLYPNYICTAHSGDLYVTLVDKRSYKITSKSRRELVQYSPTGKKKGRASHDDWGDALFVWPMRMRINNAEEVIGVTNSTDKNNNHLVLMNTDLTLRLRYLGNGKAVSRKQRFDTTTYQPDTNYAIADFTFDTFDNLILCEAYSKRIQLVSRECLPMLTLLPTQEHTPMAVTLSDDEMWLGFTDNTVKVYKYKWTNSLTTNG